MPDTNKPLNPNRSARRWQLVAAAAALAVVVALGAFMIAQDDDNETIATNVASQSDDGVIPSVGTGLDGTYILAINAPDNAQVPIVAGSEPTLTIDGDQWGGTAACNGYGGNVTVDKDANMTVGEFNWTEMGCEPDRMQSEQAFLTAIMSMTQIQVIGDKLMLTSDTSQLLMLRVGSSSPDENAEIMGIDWQLDTIIEGETARTSLDIKQSTVRFETDGTFRSTGPCLVLTGDFVFNGLELQAGSMAADYPDECGGQPGPDDQVILPHFESSRVDLADGRLTLTEGTNSLIYVQGD